MSRLASLLPPPWSDIAWRALSRPGSPEPTDRLLLVDVARQRLALVRGTRLLADYPISTAEAGIGGESGSFRTPPGWHRIARKIGTDAALGTVFVSREPTGEVWQGETRNDDLILTRLLWLEGLEPGVNRGPGVDSFERYIYVHGTNHEHRLGTPASHGCVRLSNGDILELYDQVEEGDLAAIVPPGPGAAPDPRGRSRYHYAGVGGSGMSALAQYQAMRGGRVSGSDRGFDRGERPEARAQLERLGITILPQDGSGAAGDCGAVVLSTAVEETVADVAAAKQLGRPLVHRSELLAHWVAESRAIAVAGTSGKSTTVAMAFELLRGAGRDPSVITGGDLLALQASGLWGNAWAGASDLLVVEADESDGSLVRYAPAFTVLLNLSRDHKTESEVLGMFATLVGRTRERLIVNADDARLAPFAPAALTFGLEAPATIRATELVLEPRVSHFRVEGIAFSLPAPGRHNIENALAAIAVARALDVPLADLVPALAAFRGVGRRFQSLGEARGVEVVDDFAHNPAKVEAAMAAARLRGARVLAIFQPHGYGPTRFLREDFVDTFSRVLAPPDRLWMLEVFYAGGTALRDFSAADIVAEIADQGRAATFAPSREWLVEAVAAEARPGDVVLVMGARDPSLTALAGAILARLAATA